MPRNLPGLIFRLIALLMCYSYVMNVLLLIYFLRFSMVNDDFSFKL